MTDARELDIKQRILASALLDVPFDGWVEAVLGRAAAKAGVGELETARLFPAGVTGLIGFHLDEADRAMVAALGEHDLGAMKIRERITLGIRCRLERAEPHREAVRRTLAHLALPQHAGRAVRALYRTVDRRWRAVGDDATDFHF